MRYDIFIVVAYGIMVLMAVLLAFTQYILGNMTNCILAFILAILCLNELWNYSKER